MSTLAVVGLVAGALIVLVAVWLIALYNGLVRDRNGVENAFRQIDIQLQRRHDLIPNLVETVKGAMVREQDTLREVVEARAAAVAQRESGDRKSFFGAENLLEGALGKLMAVVEDYPELKSQEHVQDLTEELRGTENKVAFARQHYNDAVEGFNTRIQQFPAVVVAGPLGFEARDFFALPDQSEVREAPRVSLA